MWFGSSRLRLVAHATGALLLALGAGYASAQDDAACPAETSPQFAANFAQLQRHLGDVMGAPVRCAQTDAEGDTIQATSTGLAIYRPSGVALFASGDQHWALSASGLQTWTGNWHNGFDPPTIEPTEPVATTPADSPASVQAMRLLGASADRPRTWLIEDEAGQRFLVEAEAGCADLANNVGGYVYLRAAGSPPAADPALIVLERRASCAIASLQPADSP